MECDLDVDFELTMFPQPERNRTPVEEEEPFVWHTSNPFARQSTVEPESHFYHSYYHNNNSTYTNIHNNNSSTYQPYRNVQPALHHQQLCVDTSIVSLTSNSTSSLGSVSDSEWERELLKKSSVYLPSHNIAFLVPQAGNEPKIILNSSPTTSPESHWTTKSSLHFPSIPGPPQPFQPPQLQQPRTAARIDSTPNPSNMTANNTPLCYSSYEDDDTSEGGEVSFDLSLSVDGQPNKRISEARLSLKDLSRVIGLNDDIGETMRREKLILGVFSSELQFPLGSKTWIRDTPHDERICLLSKLYHICENRYKFGFSKQTYNTIIRRASYAVMQRRLRRERRQRRSRF